MNTAYMMKLFRLQRIFIIAGLSALFISYLGVWIRHINDPVQRTGADFMAFYSAGRVAQEQGAAHVYDLSLQKDFQEEQVGFSLIDEQILPFIHPPFIIPVLQVVIQSDYVFSFYVWISIMLALYVIALTILNHYLKQNGFGRPGLLPLAAGALLFLPLFFSLMNGQDTAILVLGTVLWVYGLFTGKQYLAGIGLSLSTIRPHIGLIFGIVMLFSYPKVFLGFVLGSGLLGLISTVLLGMDGWREFVHIIELSAGGAGYGTKEYAMFNLIGFLARAFPQIDADLIRSIGWACYVGTIVVLCILWRSSKNIQDGLIGLTIILTLFAVPHLHFHDLTLLLIPIYELVYLSKTEKLSFMITLPVAISLLLLLSNISISLQFTVPYLIMLALAMYPYAIKSRRSATALRQS